MMTSEAEEISVQAAASNVVEISEASSVDLVGHCLIL
jgi:hypothetical protein